MSGNFGNGLGDTAMQGVEGQTTDSTSFFEQIKKPLEDLNTFVNDFNNKDMLYNLNTARNVDVYHADDSAVIEWLGYHEVVAEFYTDS